jgi:DNA-binding transcriptional LysR family regulator
LVNLRDVEVFHAVMVGGGTGRAAELLATSQPTISRTLARLEATLSLKLFSRIRGRLVPTREGRANLVGLDQLRQSAARIREVGDGIIRIASLAAMGHGIVPRAIARFSADHPNVTVSYQVRTSGVVRDLIASGRFDIGLAADEIDSSGVDATVFATPRAVCAVPSGHKLAGRKHITAKHLAGEPLIVLSPQDSVRRAMDRAFADAGVTPKIVVETPYSLTVAALVKHGAGIGFVNPYALEGMDRASIVVRPFEPAIHFRALLLRTPGAPASALIEAFLKRLYEERGQRQ